jgi:two-component system nitrogen regulation sensor histidine kinase NtrY
MSPLIEEANIKFKLLPIPPNTTINADSKLIEQVLINLINNANQELNIRDIKATASLP